LIYQILSTLFEYLPSLASKLLQNKGPEQLLSAQLSPVAVDPPATPFGGICDEFVTKEENPIKNSTSLEKDKFNAAVGTEDFVDVQNTGNFITNISPSISSDESRQPHELKDSFEDRRNLVSKEVSTNLALGWTLLDMSCPNCGMPLMTDPDAKNEVCVLCNTVGELGKTTVLTKEKHTNEVGLNSSCIPFQQQEKSENIEPSLILYPRLTGCCVGCWVAAF